MVINPNLHVLTSVIWFQCPKPVIAAIHNACIGGGVDMITACDIRYCSKDAYFVIKVRKFQCCR